ncbi:MFS transporter [Actinoplanes sp. NPDC023714]|uniref:MFS transporter n=1 Tax=Actinoplanes sp. NPDC023714 TaxID=3154322 RepID=UPI0033E5FBEB
MKQLNDLIADFWADYAALVLLGGGLLGVIALIGLFVWAKKSQKPLRPIALAFSMNLALLLNAEGMWVIAVDQLKLPKIFAVLVFAVFEICFLTATSLAAEQYRRTTVYGPDGRILTPGHPGPMLYIAALIAAISGIIVASNAVTGTEKLLRLAVPCVIFLMWWAALTAAGQRVRRGRFAYSPRRMAERWGWLIPDDDPDLVRMASERQVRRMVVNYHRVSGGRWPKAWWKSRLLKDARTAGEPVVADVIEQLARIQRVMDLLVPGSIRVAAPVMPGGAAALLAGPGSSESAGVGVGVGVGGSGMAGAGAGAGAGGSGVAGAGGSGINGSAVNGSGVNGAGFRGAGLPAGPDGGRAAEDPVSPAAPQVRFVQPVVADAPDDFVTEALAEALAAQRNGSVGVPVPRRPAEEPPVAQAPVAPVPDVVSGPAPTPPAPVSSPSAPPAPVSPAPVSAAPGSSGPAIPAWAAIGTGARPAVSIVGSPWWRLAVDRLSKQVAQEISVEDLPDMTYPRITELARNLAARNTELGEGVVKAFVNDYIRELNGEYGEVAYPWRDFLPPPATAAPGSPAWQAALEELRTALEEELSQGVPADPYELSDLLIPAAPRLDEETVRTFIGDYLLALNGQAGSGSDQPWQHLLPRPQSARSATDEEILEAYGSQLGEYLAANGRITRNRVQSITGIKSRLQADRIKAILEERAGVPIS